MSVSSVSPSVVIPMQLFAPSVPSTQAIALALTVTPVAAAQVNHAVPAPASPGSVAQEPTLRVNAATQVTDSTSPRSAPPNLMAGTGLVESPTPAPDDPSLGRKVDVYL